MYHANCCDNADLPIILVWGHLSSPRRFGYKNKYNFLIKNGFHTRLSLTQTFPVHTGTARFKSYVCKAGMNCFFFYLLLLFCDERVVSFVFVVLGIYLAATTNCSNICDKKSTRLLETERRPQVFFFIFSLSFLLDSCHCCYYFFK